MEKLQFVKDGAIQGWVIALSITLFDYFWLALAFLGVEAVQKAWQKMGDKAIGMSAALVGVWFTYKGVKGAVEFIQNSKIALAQRERDKCADERKAGHVEEN
jgi:hypothetical protein